MSATPPVTTKAQLLAALREAGPALRALGVVRLRLFGSFARDEARSDSDVDLLVDFAPGHHTYDALYGTFEVASTHTGRRVQVMTPGGLSPYLGPPVLQEAEDVTLTP